MKFFTPDLLFRFGSEDDAVADAAQADWEKADLAYRKRLNKIILPGLPSAAKSFVKKLCLHDARLLIMAVSGDRLTVSLFLELDDPRNQGVLLHYDLARTLKVVKHPEIREPDTPVEWLYDEFDVKVSGGQKVFTHSILFTDGNELRLGFRNMLAEPYAKTAVMRVNTEDMADNLDVLVGRR